MDSRTEGSGGIREEDSDWEETAEVCADEEEFPEIKVVVPRDYKSSPPLTVVQIDEIKRRYADGETVAELMRVFGKCRATIQRWCQSVQRNVDKPKKKVKVQSEGREQPYRENLRWALEAAGEFARLGLIPESCPNDSAWFLYVQATTDPKDFMAKVSQSELKAEAPEDDQEMKRGSRRTIEEIHVLLESLKVDNG
jgi:hypothetical protein